MTWNLKFVFQIAVETRSVVYKAVVHWNDGVDDFPVMANEQVVNAVQT